MGCGIKIELLGGYDAKNGQTAEILNNAHEPFTAVVSERRRFL